MNSQLDTVSSRNWAQECQLYILIGQIMQDFDKANTYIAENTHTVEVRQRVWLSWVTFLLSPNQAVSNENYVAE
jgi:hypothetical protein